MVMDPSSNKRERGGESKRGREREGRKRGGAERETIILCVHACDK